MDRLISKILQISNEKEGKTPIQLTVKMMEELGELAEAMLSYSNITGSEYKNKSIDHVKEETMDVIIVGFALAAKLGMTTQEIKDIIDIKLVKWQKVISPKFTPTPNDIHNWNKP
jgi:NTP pyrophosphatase (non-canonical NTP hydrolase)